MPVVGLHLGNHSFKAAELERSKDGPVLKKYGIYRNPKVSFSSSDNSDIKDYSSALDAFFSEVGFSTRDVVVSLPEHEVFVRTIKVPNMSEKELGSSIQFEAEQYVPLPIKEVTLSYQLLGPDNFEKDKMEVLLVAAKKEIVTRHVDVLKKAHLVPRGLEPETLAISRVLGSSAQNPNATVIVSVNTENTLIVVAYKGFVRLTRSVAAGGDALTRAIQQGLSLDYMQAEEYKKTYGLDQTKVDGKVFAALKPVFDSIISEVNRSKVFFSSRNAHVIINKVVVSGGTALMPGLLLYMVNNLDVEVELANPWRSVNFSPKLESEQEKILGLGPLFVTPVGLALKEV